MKLEYNAKIFCHDDYDRCWYFQYILRLLDIENITASELYVNMKRFKCIIHNTATLIMKEFGL